MADSEEAKSVEGEYDSDSDNNFALRWMARRFEASDDEEDEASGEDAKEKYRWSCVSPDESDGGEESSSEFYDDLEVVGSFEEELEFLSQEGEEEKVQEKVKEMVRPMNKANSEDIAVGDEVFVPRAASFYMHDDRFLSPQYRTRRGAVIGKKIWECTDGSKWKHDKFEDMTVQDKGSPKCNGRQQWKNQTKGHGYAHMKFGSLDNYGNQNNKTSRMVKGRGTVKYKPIVKSNNLNLSTKHQIHAKSKERARSSCSSQVASRASSPDICMPWSSNERYGRRNKQFISRQMGEFPLPPLCSQKLRHPCNESHQTSFKYLAANSSIETLPQTTGPGHDLVGRRSFQIGGNQALSPVIQHWGLPYGAVDDHSPSMALARHAGLSHLSSRYGGKTRY